MPSPEPQAACAEVIDLMQHRLQRALRQRARYRYVRPQVLREGDGFRIQSPCCSRNVDSSGGPIDIALLVPDVMRGWLLCSRDHQHQVWVPRKESDSVEVLITALCTDADRHFWP